MSRNSSGELAARLDLGLDLLVPEIDGGNSDPLQLTEELDTVHPRQPGRLPRRQPPQLVELWQPPGREAPGRSHCRTA